VGISWIRAIENPWDLILLTSWVPDMHDLLRKHLAGLARETRGAVQAEYVVLLGTMGIAIVFALVAIGPALVHSFERARDMIASPFP